MEYAEGMESVGIGELRRNLSGYIAKVKAGERFSVTDRGKTVAVLRPSRHDENDEEAWQKLIDEGLVKPAKAPLSEFFSEYKPPKGEVDHERTASRYLQEMREDRV